ncbi:MAG TPA: M20/M25/M40 family metallo-hydrolase, partial [Novosphingobium sp.]|nr:M20/M25/M40 family metallo-hydrolase [Novosphingobium sp.]
MLVAYAALAGPTVHAASLRPDQQAFMATYRELVETNTELSDGDCTLAAQRMGARLAAAGLPAADITVFSVPDHPREGGLVAVLPAASGQHRRPILLLAHIDVVEARAADWQSDPFRLTEKDGYFYGRGASDDKAMAASWVDTLVRLRQQHRRLARPVKLALTCGEETEGAFNGAQWLSTHQRGLIDAAFALNEGGAGQLDAAGHRLFLGVEAEEKARQDFRLEAKGEGGHSAMPAADNAIARLAAAVGRVAALDFPVRLDSVSRAYLAARARLAGGADAAAISAFLAHPEDPAAQAPL